MPATIRLAGTRLRHRHHALFGTDPRPGARPADCHGLQHTADYRCPTTDQEDKTSATNTISGSRRTTTDALCATSGIAESAARPDHAGRSDESNATPAKQHPMQVRAPPSIRPERETADGNRERDRSDAGPPRRASRAAPRCQTFYVEAIRGNKRDETRPQGIRGIYATRIGGSEYSSGR